MTDAILIACPSCSGLNRVPEARLADAPKCGRCHEPLFTGRPVALDGQGFRNHVERADVPVVVDFWAAWCGPCRAMAPAFEQAAGQVEPRVRLAKVDTEAEPTLAGRYGIRSIPTLILFQRGQEIARQPGAMGAADIVRWIATALGR